MMIGLVQIMEETAAEGAMASRLPKLSIRKDLHPLDVWKSSMTSLLISSELREMTLPEMRSAFRICAASAESESMHTLTKRVSGYLPDSAASDIKRLAIRDPASDADQKLRSTLFPFRGARSAEDFEESTREGASEPISREWLPYGIEDERKAAMITDKKMFFVFTITCFRYTIVIRHHF